MDTLGRLKIPHWKQLPCSSSTFSFELKKKPMSLPLSFVSPSCSLSISPKVDKEQSDSAIFSTALPESDSMLVHVRFVLQMECMFGERFYLIGDDPFFGLWNPSNGIPLDWSDGHIWSARLEVPMGKKVEFKFVLLRLSGEVHWQPGPNRVLLLDQVTTSMDPQASTVTVWEDWDFAGNQKISLEDEVAVSSASSVMQDEIQVPGPDCNCGTSDQSNKTGDNPELVHGDVDSGIISSTGQEDSESDSESNSGGMILVPGSDPVKAVTQPELVQGDVDSGIVSSSGQEDESDSESNSGGMILVPVKAVTQEDDLIDPLETGDINYSLVKEITIDEYEDRSYKGKDEASLKNTSSEEVIVEPTTASILINDLQSGLRALQGFFSSLGFDFNQT
ncbi:carbohydrate-binding-like fold isoform X3 [Carex rostrata]